MNFPHYSQHSSSLRFHLNPFVSTFDLPKQNIPTYSFLQHLPNTILVYSSALTRYMRELPPITTNLKYQLYFYIELKLHSCWSILPPSAPTTTTFYIFSLFANKIPFQKSLLSWSSTLTTSTPLLQQYVLTEFYRLSRSPVMYFRVYVVRYDELQSRLAAPSQAMIVFVFEMIFERRDQSN